MAEATNQPHCRIQRRMKTEYENIGRKYTKNKHKPNCPLHGPWYDVNLCKVMQVQAKSMRDDWLYYRGLRVHVKLMRDKNHVAGGKDSNILIASDTKNYLKMKKIIKLRIRMDINWTPILKLLTLKTQTLAWIPIWDKTIAVGNSYLQLSCARKAIWIKNSSNL